MYAILAGRVRTGRDHPAFVRLAAYREGLAAQIRPAPLLDRTEERIQIKMQDFTLAHTFSLHTWANQVNRFFVTPYSWHL
jgi:hypothetical protein